MNRRLAIMAVAFLTSTACERGDSQPTTVLPINQGAPSIESAELSPGPHYRTSEITVTPKGWADPDGDLPRYRYQWYVNGAPIDEATQDTFTPPATLKKSDRVHCRVTPVDDKFEGTPVDSNEAPYMGSLPEIHSVGLVNGPYYAKSAVQADIWAEDRDGDPFTYEYQWFLNGAEVEGATGAAFAGPFKRSDKVYVRVTAVEEAPATDLAPQAAAGRRRAGLPVDSNEITIANTPPTPPAVAVYPAVVTSGGEIWASVLTPSTDDDNDFVYYTYDWYKNGELQPFAGTTTAISGSWIEGGDSWVVMVVPSDSVDQGFAGLANGPLVLFSNGEKIGGAYHTCVRPLLKNVVRCFGRNDFGQIGDGTTTTRSTPSTISPVVSSTDQITKVALGFYHTCVLLNTGVVRCWGRNADGELGRGTFTAYETTPGSVDFGGATAIDIAAGSFHTCATMSDYSVRCWGANPMGQLGNNTTTRSSLPVSVLAAATGAAQMSASELNTCVIVRSGASAGRAACWGDNSRGQVPGSANNPQLTPYIIASAPVTYRNTGGSLAVSANGACALANATSDLYCWGAGLSGIGVKLSSVLSVSAGLGHYCVLTTGYGMKCWGANHNAQLGDGTKNNSPDPVDVKGFTSGIKVVSAGALHSCAIKGPPTGNGGSMYCWGDNSYGQLGNPQSGAIQPTPLNVSPWAMAIEAGDTSTCMVTDSGGLKCWGDNSQNQLGDGTTTLRSAPTPVLASAGVPLSTVVSVAVGHYHACALRENATVSCWGRGAEGQLGNAANTQRAYPVAAAGTYSMLAAGDLHTCGITDAGDVNCWGYNGWGQLGLGDRTNRNVPTLVNLGGRKAMSITAGLGHTCVGTTSDEVWCWGANWSGQLGDGTTTQRLSPTLSVSASGGLPWRLSAHDSHTCAQYMSRNTWCWGNNSSGQLGLGDTSDRLTATHVASLSGLGAGVAAGYDHTCVLTTAGAVMCMGRNVDGEVGDGTTTLRNVPTQVAGLTSGVIALAAGGSHTCALLDGGIVKCWGRNSSGQIGNKTTGLSYSLDRPLPVDIHASGATVLGGGDFHTCDVHAGVAKCWGRNDSGQIGDNSTTNRYAPANVYGSPSPTALAGGMNHMCALFPHTITCWGDNAFGQLGIGSAVDSSVPAGIWTMPEWTEIIALYAGKCVDAPSQVDGTRLTIYRCHGGANQLWYPEYYPAGGYYVFHSGVDWNKCIDIANNAGGTDQTFVTIYTCNYGEAQRFYWNGSSLRWQSAASTRCIDVQSNGTADSTGLWMWGCNGGTAQQFEVVSQHPTRLAAGGNTTCAVSQGSGGLKCWGQNTNGQLGASNTTDRNTPTWVAQFGGNIGESFSAISGGIDHTCAVVGSGGHAGGVRCWGANGTGGLGTGDVAQRNVPTRVPELLRDNAQVSAGSGSTCVSKSAGGARCFGYGYYGQIGQNQVGDRSLAQVVAQPFDAQFNWRQDGGTNAVAWGDALTKLTSGLHHHCAIAGGNAYCWGRDTEANVNVGGNALCNGVACARSPTLVIKAVDTQIVSDISSRYMHTCAVFGATTVGGDGGVFCWGRNTDGQLGRGTATTSERLWMKFAYGSNYNKCIDRTGNSGDGTQFHIWDCGDSGNDNVAWILDARGLVHSKYDWNKIWKEYNGCGCCCSSPKIEINSYDTASDRKFRLEQGTGGVHRGAYSEIRSQTDTGRCVDLSGGNTANGTKIQPYSCNGGAAQRWQYMPLGHLAADGVYQRVGNISNFTHVATGVNFTCARRSDTAAGNVYCWGNGDDGKMGDGTLTSRYAPTTRVSLPAGTVSQIDAGYYFACALINNPGTVWCWGQNGSKLGNGGSASQSVPVQVQDIVSGGPLTNVVSITLGAYHSCARLSSGRTYCWGSNGSERLGVNDGAAGGVRYSATPVFGYGPKVRQLTTSTVGVGGFHTCFVSEGDNLLRCMGSNDRGQLGFAGVGNYTTPVRLTTLAGVTNVAAGNRHTCVIETNPGPIKCFGANDEGQLGDGTFNDRTAPTTVAGGLAFTKVVAGYAHTCGLVSGVSPTGQVRCWGRNFDGQLGDNTTLLKNTPTTVLANSGGTPLSSVVDIIAGQGHTCVLTSGNKVQCWGSNGFGQIGDNVGGGSVSTPQDVRESKGLVMTSLSMGHDHGCTTSGGGAYCWGSNANKQLGTAAGGAVAAGNMLTAGGLTSGVTFVKTGVYHSCALLTGGTVKCWGDNSYGQLGSGSSGASTDIPVTVNLGGAASDIALGLSHTCAAMAAGGIKCWGANYQGQLGNNTTSAQTTPVAVSGISAVASSLTAGYYHTCAVVSGAVRCWGFNYYGQLGDGSQTTRLTSVATGGVMTSSVTRVAAGENHTCAVRAGAAYCWGDDTFGQLGNNAATGGFIATPTLVSGLGSGVDKLSVFKNHGCVVTSGYAVRCWGANYSGQLGGGAGTLVPTPNTVASGYIDLATGGETTCALDREGLMRCWGGRELGQIPTWGPWPLALEY